MSTTQYLRGSVILCDFPYQTSPNQRGPSEHFALFVEAFEDQGKRYVAACYGTSRLDDELLAVHGGAILSIPTQFIRITSGKMPQGVGHFVCDYVAIIPEEWINVRFAGRLDFMRSESRKNDLLRNRLFGAFERFEPIMQLGAVEAAKHMKLTGQVGLPAGKKLRP